MIEEQKERGRLKLKLAKMEAELNSLRGASARKPDNTVNAFTSVSNSNYDQAKAIERLSSKVDKIDGIEKRFEELTAAW